MSLARQERALFSLLFDAELRARFGEDAASTLADLGLDAEERADFLCIRPQALELDAEMRRDLILDRLRRALPLSFSLLPDPRAARALIDVSHILTPPAQRTVAFARRLRDLVEDAGGDPRSLAIVDAEIALSAIVAARREDPAGPDPEPTPPAREAKLVLAPHVAAAVLPRPYAQLLATPGRRAGDSPVLLVARAVCTRRSRCEATVDVQRIELAGGFAPLFAQLDGSHSLLGLLDSLRAAGAGPPILRAVEAGLVELGARGLLIAATREA